MGIQNIGVQDFLDTYQTYIRVSFDKELLKSNPSTKITLGKISWKSLADLKLPWYVDGNNNPCEYNTIGARHVTVKEISKNRELLPKRTKDIVKKMVILESNSDDIASPVLPVIGADGCKNIILDGSHRIVAAFTLGFRQVKYVNVYCENMKNICPDFN
jgi:hypothetical protein